MATKAPERPGSKSALTAKGRVASKVAPAKQSSEITKISRPVKGKGTSGARKPKHKVPDVLYANQQISAVKPKTIRVDPCILIEYKGIKKDDLFDRISAFIGRKKLNKKSNIMTKEEIYKSTASILDDPKIMAALDEDSKNPDDLKGWSTADEFDAILDKMIAEKSSK